MKVARIRVLLENWVIMGIIEVRMFIEKGYKRLTVFCMRKVYAKLF